jgi:hypothetical protein
MQLWHDTAPETIEVDPGANQTVRIWNIWDTGDGTAQAWHHGAAMEVKKIGKHKYLFFARSGKPGLPEHDLVFSIEIVPRS